MNLFDRLLACGCLAIACSFACSMSTARSGATGSPNPEGGEDGAVASSGAEESGGASGSSADATIGDAAPSDATGSTADADATILVAGDGAPSCNLPGLRCYQTNGQFGSPNCTTTLSGTVYDPAGKNALYNAVVYIPTFADASHPLPPIVPGTATCNVCDAYLGDYIAAAATDSMGRFTMVGVPATTNVPVVVQVGKWRRVIFIDAIKACQDNIVPDRTLRLPRNHMEGDMPQMGVLTGGCDDLGCFLRGIGIDAAEFSAPHGGGRLDVYQGMGAPIDGSVSNAPGLSNGTAGDCTGTGCPLWSSKQDLEYYDMVLLACECDENNQTKPATAIAAMHDWLSEGGKVFATHFHYTWFKNGPPDFQGVANWLGASQAVGMGSYSIDTSFPKGLTFSHWLENAGAATDASIQLTTVASSVAAVNAPTTRWIYDPSTTPNETKYLSFLTPIGGIPPTTDAASGPLPAYCGKGIFTDLHASGSPSGDVPGSCTGADLTAQQKALEFLLFDLAACVVPEPRKPPPPIPPMRP